MNATQPIQTRASLAELLVDQRRRWRRGERPGVEQYLANESALGADTDAVLDLIYNEVLLREQDGQRPRLDEYLARFPQLAESLRIQFELDEAIQACQPVGSEEPAARLPLASQGPARFGSGEAGGPYLDMALESLPAVAGYQLLSVLGRGGMGVVYKARDIRLDRLVALKFLLPERYLDEATRQRFENEIHAASALNHPNICTIYQIGSHGGQPFIAMEYIQGRTLRDLGSLQPCADFEGRVCRLPCSLRTCPFFLLSDSSPVGSESGLAPVPLESLLPAVRQAARALAAAHAAGIVHRDIKPENIMVRDDGYAKIVDFGLSRLMPAEQDDAGPERFVGTLPYMSPEQVRGEAITAAGDVFSLGIVLYELATGRHPFAGGEPSAVLDAILLQAPPSPASLNRDLPSPLIALIERMLAKDPRLRPTAPEVARALIPFSASGGVE